LVRAVADIIEKFLDQLGRDALTGHTDRSFDSLALLLPRHTGHQILAVVQSFRQTPELRTLAKKFRPDREDYVNRKIARLGCRKLTMPCGGKQKLHKRRRFFPATSFGGFGSITYQFFKLVNYDEQAVPGLQMRMGEFRQT
jgi:hypothetical protein